MTQLNTPYPAGAHLVAYLKGQGLAASQVDLSLALALDIFSARGLAHCFAAVRAAGIPVGYEQVVANAPRYQRIIEVVIRFLQGKESGLAARIVRCDWLPQGPRFAACDLDAEQAAFGSQGITDQARWLATLMIQDLADCFRLSIAPHFGLTSYGHALAESAVSFDSLATYLGTAPNAIEQRLLNLLPGSIAADCGLVALTAPFPGNIPAALRIAQWLKEHRPFCHVVLGGGFASTELRELSDPRIFDVVDSIVLDDGEEPLRRIIAGLRGETVELLRTYRRVGDRVVWHQGGTAGAAVSEPRHGALPPPDYADLPLHSYLDLLDTWNPMQRLWNEGRWLKLIAAHGCYWSRCSFCDTSLPYIADYQPARASTIAQRMREMAAQTGQRGFHFTDEAAPPRLMVDLALELLRGGDQFHWWGNIRFEKSFTPDRCRLLNKAGMIAVSGGIEVADDEILQSIGKGVSIPELIPTLSGFSAAGIMVHGYLMYGFPGQKAQHTINSLELVRQLIAGELLHSGFWHRFTVTAHSPVGLSPADFGVTITGPQKAGFAWNNLQHQERDGIDHDQFHAGLVQSMQAWLAGQHLEQPVNAWFAQPLPLPTHAKNYVQRLQQAAAVNEVPAAADSRVVWLGELPEVDAAGLRVVNESGELMVIELDPNDDDAPDPDDVAAIAELLTTCHPSAWPKGKPPQLSQLDYELEDLAPWREVGLVLV